MDCLSGACYFSKLTLFVIRERGKGFFSRERVRRFSGALKQGHRYCKTFGDGMERLS